MTALAAAIVGAVVGWVAAFAVRDQLEARRDCDLGCDAPAEVVVCLSCQDELIFGLPDREARRALTEDP